MATRKRAASHQSSTGDSNSDSAQGHESRHPLAPQQPSERTSAHPPEVPAATAIEPARVAQAHRVESGVSVDGHVLPRNVVEVIPRRRRA